MKSNEMNIGEREGDITNHRHVKIEDDLCLHLLGASLCFVEGLYKAGGASSQGPEIDPHAADKLVFSSFGIEAVDNELLAGQQLFEPLTAGATGHRTRVDEVLVEALPHGRRAVDDRGAKMTAIEVEEQIGFG